MAEGSGGVAAHAQGFQERGLSDPVHSWISTDASQAITPEQLEQGLGQEQLQQLAAPSGLALEAVLPMLSQLLPTVIAKLTPQGAVLTGGWLAQALNLFGSHDEETPHKA